jgi:four helix bundle protein
MKFNHQKLDVYRLSIEYVTWVYNVVDHLTGKHRHARDQLLRASQSVPLNIAEGNGKFSGADRRRFFAIARGSALECAAIHDVLVAGAGISRETSAVGETLLVRIVAMLTKMARQDSGGMAEEPMPYRVGSVAAMSCDNAADGDGDGDGDGDHDHDGELR